MRDLQLAIARYAEGKLEEAVEVCRGLLERDGNHVDALNLLGVIQGQWRHSDAALRLLTKAATLRPRDPAIIGNLGNVLLDLQQLDKAEQCFRTVILLNPDSSDAHNSLGNALRAAGRLDEATKSFLRALELDPRSARALANFAHLLRDVGQIGAAELRYREALSIDPDFADAHCGLGVALLDGGAVEEATNHLRRALSLRPNYAEAFNNLGAVYLKASNFEAAIECYRKAMQSRPDFVEAHSNLIFALDFKEAATLVEQQDERRCWYALHGQRFSSEIAPHGNQRDPGKVLRVGYVSADFRRHSAYYAFGPVIRGHDPRNVEVYCYSGVLQEDDATAALRKIAKAWRSTVGVPDAVMAQQIRDDGIDILVDLSGHSARNRLMVFARKPAPVQVTAWGHATGTGLETIDYLFSDPVAIPKAGRQLFAEEIVDLPCFIPYDPPEYMLDVSPLPAETRGHLTLGYVNRLAKVSDPVIALWGRLVASAPKTRLLIKAQGLENRAFREQVLRRLREVGDIDARCVTLLGASSHADHLKVFHEIDVLLDPFPHGGGISSSEALWMGVPVVTIIGATPSSRSSAALVTAVGMEDWVAEGGDDYIGIVLAAQSDLRRLKTIRKELRNRVKRSSHGDLAAYTQAVEKAYRSMWRRWCKSGQRE